MQRGIDSYFKKLAPISKKRIGDDDDDITGTPAHKKRKLRVISDDEDDEVIPVTPKANEKNKTPKKMNMTNGKSPNKKSKLSKLNITPKKKELTKVDPVSLFGGETHRSTGKKPVNPKEKCVIEFEDSELDQSLMDIDMEQVNNKVHENVDDEKKTNKEKLLINNGKNEEDRKQSTPQKKETKDKSPKNKEKQSHEQQHKEHNKVKEEKITPPSTKKSEKVNVEKTPKSEEKKVKKDKNTPKAQKEQYSDLDNSILTDEERHERKRIAAVLYQKFKNRSSCLNPGSKEVPKGKPNCLAGLNFLITGVLESLERDECASIIKELGGKVMSTVGKRLQYMIVGDEAGPKKLATAEELGVKIINEDELFDLIRKQSGDKTKNSEKTIKKHESPEKPSISPKNKNKEKQSAPTKVKANNTPIKKDKLIDVKVEKVNLTTIQTKTVEKSTVDESLLAWVDKYKPTNVKDIIGQQGAASNVIKLTNWVSKWYINHDGKKKLQKPNPWAKNDDGSYYKAALLSGPPGIGKTTTATLVCRELGFDVVEFNASDTRSKRLLKEEVSELLTNKSLYGFCHGESLAVSKKHVLIMDEVDGMAGNEDRGGIQELIGLIKESSVPIICMCNDRNHQKMRSLVNYCYDLRFNRPRLEQIKGRIMSICFKEDVKLDKEKIDEIITATNNDIRQSINHISLLAAGKNLNLKSDQKGAEKVAEKDLKLGPWEVVRKVFTAEEHKRMSFNDKCDLFFHDYSLAPLFVQQNYLQVSPSGPKCAVLEKVAKTANALSLSDLADKRIRSNAAWSLLPTQSIFSSVMPGEYMSGHFTGQINFPGWLGKNSRANKRKRLAQEIHDHTRLRTSGSRLSIRLDYAPFLLSNIVRPLKEKGLDGVEEALNVIKEYHLLREDIDALIELTTWPGKKGPMDAVDGRVKAALTRAYNKEVLAYSYSVSAGVKKKRTEAVDDAEELLNEGEEGEDGGNAALSDDENDDDNLENDGLIKTKKKIVLSTTGSTKASGSKSAAGKNSNNAKSATTKLKKQKIST